MDQNQDFSKLRDLLALKKLEMPTDTRIDQFLIEFHRRQRAQLIVQKSLWDRTITWLKERATGFEFVPSLSYASAFVAIAITVCVGFSQQAQVTQTDDQNKLSFRMSAHDTSFAMIPAAFVSASTVSQKLTDSLNFTPGQSDSTTRFVLANNSRVAYDANATVAF